MITPDLRHDEATIAIVTALPIEFVAMKAMLDDPDELSTAGNAPGKYVLGTIPSKAGELLSRSACSRAAGTDHAVVLRNGDVTGGRE
jgi:hypothetical protein